MSRTLLVGYDGSPRAASALSLAVSEWPEATVVLLTVVDPIEAGFSTATGVPTGAEEWYERARADAETALSEATAAYDRSFETRIEVGRPAATLVEVAEEDRFDHVILGSHGRTGLTRILLGSVAEAVVRKAPVPVTVARE
ncbi:MAG: universal stress protein [Halolamina sp.]